MLIYIIRPPLFEMADYKVMIEHLVPHREPEVAAEKIAGSVVFFFVERIGSVLRPRWLVKRCSGLGCPRRRAGKTPSRLAAALGLGELCLHALQPKRQLVALFAQLLVLSLQLVHVHASGRTKRHLDEAARV